MKISKKIGDFREKCTEVKISREKCLELEISRAMWKSEEKGWAPLML